MRAVKRATGVAGKLRGAALAALLLVLPGCPEPPPPGLDLVEVTCICDDGCKNNEIIPIPGYVCTDASVPENLEQALEFICESKETLGIFVCKIDNCGSGIHFVTPGGCPADNGDFHSGDFGQTLASAIAPSSVDISGDDINAFSIEPESFLLDVTQSGTELFFGRMDGRLGTTKFTSDGIFGDDEHTLAEGRLAAAPFTVELSPGGEYEIPPGVANFITTGLVDGDRLSLTLTTISLGGVYDEEAGIFTMTGQVEAVGADLDLDVDLTFELLNRPPRALISGDPIIECDAAGGTGAAFLSGAGSFDLDGPQDIAFYTWYVDGAEEATGQDAVVPIALGLHEVTLVVADQRGSFGDDFMDVLVEDTTAPAIDIVEPQAVEYAHSDTIILDYAAVDGCTGVDMTTALLDGSPTVGGHGLPSGQPIDLLTELPLGPHTFRVDTTDLEGNASFAEVTFTVVATPESLQEAVRRFYELGHITQQSGGDFVLARLAEAAVAYHAGNCDAATGIYGSFINAVEALTGNKIDPFASAILIDDARALIGNCS